MAVRKEREKNHETYSISPRHGIDRESFRHDERDEGPSSSIAEENRPEQDELDMITSARGGGHSPSVTEDVTIMSQEGFQLSSGAAPPSLTTAPTRSPSNSIFCSPSTPPLVMSARMRKERTSDSQIFDSIQGNYSHFILSVSVTPFSLPLSETTPVTTPAAYTDLVLRIKAKLNHRADSQGAQPALVTDLYELSTLSERLIILRSNSSEPLLDHRQSDVLDREGWFHLFPIVLVP